MPSETAAAVGTGKEVLHTVPAVDCPGRPGCLQVAESAVGYLCGLAADVSQNDILLSPLFCCFGFSLQR